jgi:hypothetical protein
MNRRQKKLEKKRKKRDQAKKKARAQLARRPPPDVLLLGAAARSPMDSCYLSAGWDNDEEPELVTAVVTRKLPDQRLVAGIALVDRTCLGIKDGYFDGPMTEEELEEYLDRVGEAHGGVDACSPEIAQSVVYHAIDYARKLGFEPHRDFPEKLFGPRPEKLMDTPWAAEERPLYVMGLRDDIERITATLDASVGAGNYDVVDPMEFGEEDEDVIEAEVVEKPPEASSR